MASGKRMENESFVDYRKRLTQTEKALRLYCKRPFKFDQGFDSFMEMMFPIVEQENESATISAATTNIDIDDQYIKSAESINYLKSRVNL